MPRNSDDAAHSQAIQVIANARENCRSAVLRLEAFDDIKPETVFATGDGDRPHLQHLAHAHLLDFHGQLAPKKYSDKASDIWEEQIAVVRVPEEAVIESVDDGESPDAGATVRVEGDDWQDAIIWDDEPLRLSTLHKIWNMRLLTVEHHQHKRHTGGDDDTIKRRMWLPPKAARPIYDQLNAVLADLGLLMDVELQTAIDAPSFVPDHIKEQAPAYQT